ncbi:MAG TPA: 50S ribosomal protein L30 [Candidatus Saccharicenans sp.]|jgi:large subunit ribosomal protein L30|nr:50S ribosomal protein L30 [Candidatus Saccharicenans sp.]HNS04932.1 50S ribosomal protein L30 [Candidatus Saccharicenans sp.]HQO76356.1 50S ribosomal protein L30 [Candidatus Saccharicenans sp.]
MQKKKYLKIKLVRSLIGRPEKQQLVARGLGLKKLNSEVVREDRPEIRGMVRKISHLVKVEEIEQP